MKPLVVLLVTFLLALLAIRLITGIYDPALSGRIALSVMLLFTTIGHFKFPKGMAMMLPPAVPYKTGMVYFTGIIELLAAIGLLIPQLQRLTGWLLILFFILILPANMYAAMKGVDYEKGTYTGSGRRYLWFRIPLQLFFIAWTYFTAIRY